MAGSRIAREIIRDLKMEKKSKEKALLLRQVYLKRKEKQKHDKGKSTNNI